MSEEPTQTDALAALVEAIPLPTVIVDRDRKLLACNETARRELAPVPLGRDLAQFIRNPAVLNLFDTVRKTGRTAQAEITLTSRNGRTFDIKVSPQSSSDGGDTESIIMCFSDTSNIHRAKEVRSTFVADASHELRSPLTTLVGGLETLSGKAGSDEKARARFLDLMKSETERMKHLIDDLLSLTATEIQQHIQPTAHVDLFAVLKRAENRVQENAATRSIAIKVNDQFPDALVKGDEDQLFQVFQNLFDNAIKYGARDNIVTVTVEHAARNVLGHAESAKVTVCNQGEPIPAEHIPRLTDRFYRVDQARSREAGGTGLGLAIVKHIVGRHKGRLQISSDSETGTCFSVFIPLISET